MKAKITGSELPGLEGKYVIVEKQELDDLLAMSRLLTESSTRLLAEKKDLQESFEKLKAASEKLNDHAGWLLEMYKKLQEENIRLTEALIGKKVLNITTKPEGSN